MYWILQLFSQSLQWRHNEGYGVSNHRRHDFYSSVCSDADQRKHQSSASLAFVKRIRRWPVNSPHIGPVTRKTFPFDDVIMTRAPWFLWLCCSVSPDPNREHGCTPTSCIRLPSDLLLKNFTKSLFSKSFEMTLFLKHIFRKYYTIPDKTIIYYFDSSPMIVISQ